MPDTPRDIVRPLLQTRQVREFTSHPVDQGALDAVTDVARWSGSSTNSQPWRFVVIRDRETLRTIHDAGLPSTRSLATAPAAIAIVLPQKPGSGVIHGYDEGRAAERMLIAATMLGLGAAIAWIGSDGRPAVAERLGLPDDRYVRTIVAIGHPSEAAQRPKSARGKARLPREETVFDERWPA
jgi:nitroreductase